MNIFLKDDLPYLLTVLIGLAAYQINNIISIHTDSPIIAYHFDVVAQRTVDGNIQRELECTLVNYSRKHAIKDIGLSISYKSNLPNPKKVKNPAIIPVAPSAILPDTMTSSAYGLINEYRIPIIHPYAKYILTLETTTNPKIEELPKLYLNSQESIRLVPSNAEVFLIRNQIGINVTLLLIWLSFALFYLFYLSGLKHNKDESTS